MRGMRATATLAVLPWLGHSGGVCSGQEVAVTRTGGIRALRQPVVQG